VTVDLEVSTEPHALIAATYGSGAWRIALGPATPDDIIFADGFD
jgi:hypothetical protein